MGAQTPHTASILGNRTQIQLNALPDANSQMSPKPNHFITRISTKIHRFLVNSFQLFSGHTDIRTTIKTMPCWRAL